MVCHAVLWCVHYVIPLLYGFTHVSKVCIGAAVGSLLSVVQAVGGDRKRDLL